MTDISQAFAKYVTNDASFSQVGKYLSKDSPIYEMISRMESYWYTPHDKYEFKNVKTSEYKYYSENCFSYRIQFDHYVYRIQANYTRHEQCDYTFVFAKKGNDWIVYDMIFNNNSNNPQVETST